MTRRQELIWQENLLLDPAQAQHCFVSVLETCYQSPLGGGRKNPMFFSVVTGLVEAQGPRAC